MKMMVFYFIPEELVRNTGHWPSRPNDYIDCIIVRKHGVVAVEVLILLCVICLKLRAICGETRGVCT
jgi:hypothetical protein